MDAPRLRSNPAAAGPERALRKEVTALADRLKALTAEEERAHAATLARFDDTDDVNVPRAAMITRWRRPGSPWGGGCQQRRGRQRVVAPRIRGEGDHGASPFPKEPAGWA